MTSPLNALSAPLFFPGNEPLPPGVLPEEVDAWRQAQVYQKWIGYIPESCPFKLAISGAMGFGLGGFFSLMQATFAYEDPLSRASGKLANATLGTQAKVVFRDMGRNMWSSGRGFAKVGALYAGTECIIEGYRAKNDITNAVSAGFVSGAVLARNSGPKAMLGGGAAFAAFSYAIDWYMRKPPAEEM
ncbi:Tim17/Tim22/Tim23/Pmp24 family-domain-containing protein [Kockovaella imperatae]|uniref:Mitochondrial import inner membrane translocase subunit TIM22 n=1 Tax=Kockovaella imperatae TaxID=4999 RepID=A0A1Y1UDA1_9TREE|nr:Tim17/Tim22/Tim23/Pmp24 family-domain-containing protein [Kockovaella imperatae]ORX36003.1 Tim17/Tim22/Tim23/Pmp24 family-domain-containing protein [Kockovaella imperatae]